MVLQNPTASGGNTELCIVDDDSTLSALEADLADLEYQDDEEEFLPPADEDWLKYLPPRPDGLDHWMPARHTPPLSEDFPSVWKGYGPAIQVWWKNAYGYELGVDQVWLLDHLTELYPEGHPEAGQLRFRQGLETEGRQNGKSEKFAAITLAMMLRKPRQTVIGVAYNVEQAGVIYNRVRDAIRRNKYLRDRFKESETRGIRGLGKKYDGTSYKLKPGKEAAMQSIPIDVGLLDEIHLLQESTWDAALQGLGSRPDTIVFGLTTAGNRKSKLLVRLRDQGEAAILLPPARNDQFYAVWEANNPVVPKPNPKELQAAKDMPDGPEKEAALELLWRRADWEFFQELVRANPGLATGRRQGKKMIADNRKQPDAKVIQFALNRDVEDVNAWMSLNQWLPCTAPASTVFPEGPAVFSIRRSQNKRWTTITRAKKGFDGLIYTSVVGQWPHLEDWQLQDKIDRIIRKAREKGRPWPKVWAVDRYQLPSIYDYLIMQGQQVRGITGVDLANGAETLYAKVEQKQLVHWGDAILTSQIPMTKMRAMKDTYTVHGSDSSTDIDAVLSTLQAVYIEDTWVDRSTGIYVYNPDEDEDE